MNFITPELVTAASDLVVAVISLTLTVALPMLSARVYKLIGVKIEEKHMVALHSGIATWAENAIKRGVTVANAAAFDDLEAYLKKSVPDAIGALRPSADVLIRIATRYINEKS